MAGVYINYGCGPACAPAEWINFDASPTLRFERVPLAGKFYTKNSARFPANVRYGDIVRGLPVAPNRVDGLYASHVLNTVPRDDCHRALANSFAILKPGTGCFRLVVPDLEWRARRYLSESGPQAAERFLRSASLGVVSRPRGLVRFLVQSLGKSSAIWVWDEASMTDALRKAGFSRIRRCTFGDADDPMFRLVEDEGRFVCDGAFPELALEARK